MSKTRYLTAQEVIAVNVAVIQKYSQGEHIGVKSSNLLESAVGRSQSSAFEQDAYPTIFDKAASLFESLRQNHPFQNGNKRTAFTALVLFLRYNGFHFKMDTREAEELTVDMVNHKYSLAQFTCIIKKHSFQ